MAGIFARNGYYAIAKTVKSMVKIVLYFYVWAGSWREISKEYQNITYAAIVL